MRSPPQQQQHRSRSPAPPAAAAGHHGIEQRSRRRRPTSTCVESSPSNRQHPGQAHRPESPTLRPEITSTWTVPVSRNASTLLGLEIFANAQEHGAGQVGLGRGRDCGARQRHAAGTQPIGPVRRLPGRDRRRCAPPPREIPAAVCTSRLSALRGGGIVELAGIGRRHQRRQMAEDVQPIADAALAGGVESPATTSVARPEAAARRARSRIAVRRSRRASVHLAAMANGSYRGRTPDAGRAGDHRFQANRLALGRGEQAQFVGGKQIPAGVMPGSADGSHGQRQGNHGRRRIAPGATAAARRRAPRQPARSTTTSRVPHIDRHDSAGRDRRHHHQRLIRRLRRRHLDFVRAHADSIAERRQRP